MTAIKENLNILRPFATFSRKMLQPPRNTSISSIWPTSGGQWRPVKNLTKFLHETLIAPRSPRG